MLMMAAVSLSQHISSNAVTTEHGPASVSDSDDEIDSNEADTISYVSSHDGSSDREEDMTSYSTSHHSDDTDSDTEYELLPTCEQRTNGHVNQQEQISTHQRRGVKRPHSPDNNTADTTTPTQSFQPSTSASNSASAHTAVSNNQPSTSGYNNITQPQSSPAADPIVPQPQAANPSGIPPVGYCCCLTTHFQRCKCNLAFRV